MFCSSKPKSICKAALSLELCPDGSALTCVVTGLDQRAWKRIIGKIGGTTWNFGTLPGSESWVYPQIGEVKLCESITELLGYAPSTCSTKPMIRFIKIKLQLSEDYKGRIN